MKSRRQRRELGAWCGQLQPDDGIDPREALSRRGGSRNRVDRKGQQVARQAFRTLSVALSGCRDALLQGLEVVSVYPAPDATHLVVMVRLAGPAAEPERAAVIERLQAARGWLRSEVAAGLTRRRAPDLTFRLAEVPEVRA